MIGQRENGDVWWHSAIGFGIISSFPACYCCCQWQTFITGDVHQQSSLSSFCIFYWLENISVAIHGCNELKKTVLEQWHYFFVLHYTLNQDVKYIAYELCLKFLRFYEMYLFLSLSCPFYNSFPLPPPITTGNLFTSLQALRSCWQAAVLHITISQSVVRMGHHHS